MTARRDHRTQDALVSTWLRHIAQKCDVSERIKQWRQIEDECSAKARETDDPHVRIFNQGMAQIARLEVQAAVTEKMKQ